jgi:hypothetical protein
LDKSLKFQHLTLAGWEAAFRPGMAEFAASNFSFTFEAQEQVRIAFGNLGPVVDTEGNREPVYTHAVTIPPALAVELARLLLQQYAKPADDPKEPIAAI